MARGAWLGPGPAIVGLPPCGMPPKYNVASLELEDVAAAAPDHGSVIKTVDVPLEEISIAENSGWRPLDEERVQELVTTFTSGEMGMTILANPSLRAVAGVVKLDVDGKKLLNQGKQTVAALQYLKQVAADGGWFAETGLNKPVWMTPVLEYFFEKGLHMDVVEYREDDVDVVIECQAMAHDSENVKYAPTSIQMKVAIVRRRRARVAGGDWQSTAKALTASLGASKKPQIYNWIAAAKAMDDTVLELLARRRYMSQSLVWNNKFILGSGANARFKLQGPAQLALFQLLFEKLDSGGSVSVSAFQDVDRCARAIVLHFVFVVCHERASVLSCVSFHARASAMA